MVDVFLQLPGATADEVERRLVTPLEKALFEIPGVEHVYSTSQPSGGMIIVRYLVGTDPDRAALAVHTKLAEKAGELPAGAPPPLVVPRGIDDVPALAYTLWSTTRDAARAAPGGAGAARRAGAPSARRPGAGARRRPPRGHGPLRPRAAGRAPGLDPAGPPGARRARLEAAGGQLRRRATSRPRSRSARSSARPTRSPRAVGRRPTAAGPSTCATSPTVTDGPDEPAQYVWMTAGAAGAEKGLPAGLDTPAVTLAIAKKPGTNAVELVAELDALVARLRGPVLPANVEITKTRDYGFTADEKSIELMKHLGLATLSVVLLMAFALGRREAVVVAVAVPVTLALTLAASYLFGYTLNRVTLFALIFAIGILVDDAIVVVENIHRHFQLGWTNPAPRDDLRHRRGRQPDHPRHLHGDRRAAAARLRLRPDGPLHAADPDQRLGGDALLAAGRLRGLALADLPALPEARRGDGRRRTTPKPEAETEQESRLDRLYQKIFAPLLASRFKRWALLGAIAAAARRLGDALPAARRGGQDAAARQQERAAGGGRHARGHDPRAHRRGRPRARDGGAPAARGHRRPDLRRHLGAVQLQRPGPPLLPALGPAGRRPAGQPAAQAPPRPRQPPVRQGAAAAARADRRSATAPTSRSPRCRPVRRCSRRWSPRSTRRRAAERLGARRAGQGDLRVDARRGRRRLVRRGTRPEARARGRPREGGARRRLARGGRAHAAGRPRRRRRRPPGRPALARAGAGHPAPRARAALGRRRTAGGRRPRRRGAARARSPSWSDRSRRDARRSSTTRTCGR